MFSRAALRRLGGFSEAKWMLRGMATKPGRTASKVMDDKMQYKWFLLVAAFGTMVYINVVKRIQEQDHSSNLEKYKKEFTPAEWESYISQIERKTMLLSHNEECYMVPSSNGNTRDSKVLQQIAEQIGIAEKDRDLAVIDLNELVKFQLDNASAKYHVVLRDNFDSFDSKSAGLKYSFTYKLRPGLFTQLINDAIKSAKEQRPDIGRFLIISYPCSVKEAVKFEQNISTNDFVIKLNKNNDSNIIQYYETVDKSILVSDLQKLEPLKIDTSLLPRPVSKPQVKDGFQAPVCLADIVPDESSSAIHRAQYKLRQLKEPIRLFGESDEDIINRLSSLQK